MKILLLTFLFSFFVHILPAQVVPSIDWQKCLGGSENEAAFAVQQTDDGGFIVSGYSDSNNGDVSGNHGVQDYWVVKLDAASNLSWQKSLGGNSIDQATSVDQTVDGGFIVAGYSYSNNGDVSGNHGSSDYWIVKLGFTGNLLWQKALGGSGDDGANSIQQTADYGFIIAGYSSSNDGDVTGNQGMWDYWIVKLDSSGNLEWQNLWEAAATMWRILFRRLLTAVLLQVATSESVNGDVSSNNGARDFWITRLDENGDLLWETPLGGSGYDEAYAVQQTDDGEFVIAGFAGSNDFDVSGYHGGYDFWVVKLDSTGTLLSQHCFGGTSTDQAFSLGKTNDNGFVVAGQSLSNNGDVSGNHGGYDFWMVKTDADVNLEWQKSMGGSSDEYGPYSLQETFDGGFILSGSSLSNDGDVSGNHGGSFYGDCWVVKLIGGKPTGVGFDSDHSFSIYPNPAQTHLYILLTVPFEDVSVAVFDMQGRIIMLPVMMEKNEIVLRTEKLPEGIYVVEISNNQTEEMKVSKFLKKN